MHSLPRRCGRVVWGVWCRYAAPGSPLWSIGQRLLRLEQLSHVLVWTKDDPAAPGQSISIHSVELPRLRLTFTTKMLMQHDFTVSPVQSRLVPRFFSRDHVGFYLSNARHSFTDQVCVCKSMVLVVATGE